MKASLTFDLNEPTEAIAGAVDAALDGDLGPAREIGDVELAAEAIDYERSRPGGIVWHSSEEEGGPDCGLELILTPGVTFYVGEVSDELLEGAGIEDKESPTGWWTVLFGADRPLVLGPVADTHEAQEIIERMGMAIRSPSPPTGAR